MPEGHVIEAQARALTKLFRNSEVAVDSPQGRFNASVANGRRFNAAEAFGKHLFLRLANDVVIHVHLGLYGKWVIAQGSAPDVRGAIRLRLRNDRGYAELRGPAKCEVISVAQMCEVIEGSGVDPLRKDADPTPVWDFVSTSRSSIGTLLMRQDLFAGVGNIYRAEVLFRAGVSPFRPGRDVAHAEFDVIWRDLASLMAYGVEHGRIDTVRPEHAPEAMGREPRRDRHGGEVYVYRRAGQHCFVCDSIVRQQDVQGRKLYWCAECQPS